MQQKPLARAFFHPLFCAHVEEEEALCCGAGTLAMAATLLLTKAKGHRVTLVAFRPEADGGT